MRIARLSACLFLLGLLCLAHARPGPDSNYNIAISGGGGSYTGPIDVIASANNCYSVRACSAALRGTKALNVCDDTGANCADFLTDATTGDLIVTTRGSNNCASTGTCRVQTAYDQVAANNCNGGVSKCDITQATNSARPLLIPSCIGGKYCLSFASASSETLASASAIVSLSQPYTFSDVSVRTSGVTLQDITRVGSEAYYNGANTRSMFAGTAQSVGSVTDGNWHIVQSVFNGASSNMYIDGSANTVNPGSNATGATAIKMTNGATNGDVTEIIIWAIALTTTGGNQAGQLCTNQKTYYTITGTTC